MLLLYLYTLEDPGFSDFPTDFYSAMSAYIIGDKYQVLGLKSHAQVYLEQSIKVFSFRFCEISPPARATWIRMHRILWSSYFPVSDKIRSASLENLIPMSKHIVEHDAFQSLLRDNPEFNLEFVRALAQKACKD